MRVRIRFGKGPRIEKKSKTKRRAALAFAALLSPATFLALALGLWRIAADLAWTSSFAISSGFFSHWHVWMAVAAALHLCSRVLNRYGKGADVAAPEAEVSSDILI